MTATLEGYWDAIQGQQLEDERCMKILLALDECRSRGVSQESLQTLIYETGASRLYKPKEGNDG